MNAWTYPCLLADVGGTHLRLAICKSPGAAPTRIERLATADYPGMTDAVKDYLQRVGREGAGTGGHAGSVGDPPRAAAIAIAAPAGPARQGPIHLTNERFELDGAALARAVGLDAYWLVNDFEALAWSLPTLPDASLTPVGSRLPGRDATMAVVGPGTGLGCAGLLRHASGWLAVPGEGGHVTLAGRTPFERQVIDAAGSGGGHISAERLLSGIGMPTLFSAVARVRGVSDASGAAPSARQITDQAALDRAAGRTDSLSQCVVDTFCDLLGSYAGNVALMFGATGGVLIGGGVASHLSQTLINGNFRRRFEDKGRFSSYLAPIGTALIGGGDQPALAGLVNALASALPSLPIQTGR